MQDGPRYLTETDLSVLTTTAQTALGSPGVTGDGRRYRYVKFGGTATIVSGKLLVAGAVAANSTGLAVATANTTAQLSQGSMSIIITNGATAVTQDQFAQGFMEVLGTNGIGQSYQIAGNTADAAGSANITVTLSDPLRNTTALANGTNTVNLTKSPYDSPNVSTTQSLPVGCTIMPVPNSSTVTNYGWVQTSGLAYLAATSGTKGQTATQDVATTAGNVANSGAATTTPIGTFKESASSTLAPVFLNLA